jgi:hypothetical protein
VGVIERVRDVKKWRPLNLNEFRKLGCKPRAALGAYQLKFHSCLRASSNFE